LRAILAFGEVAALRLQIAPHRPAIPSARQLLAHPQLKEVPSSLMQNASVDDFRVKSLITMMQGA
jgi:hypothetical protein